MTLTGVAAWPALAADVKLSIEIPRLNVAEYHRPLCRGLARARRPELRRQYRGLVRPQAQGQRRHQVAQGHAPVVAPLGPRAHDAGRRPVQRDASARRAPAPHRARQGAVRGARRRRIPARRRGGARSRRPRTRAHSVPVAAQGGSRLSKPKVNTSSAPSRSISSPEIRRRPNMRNSLEVVAARVVLRAAGRRPGASRVDAALRHDPVGRRSLGHGRRRGVERPVLFRALSAADRQHRQAARGRAGGARRAAGPASRSRRPTARRSRRRTAASAAIAAPSTCMLTQKGTYKIAVLNEGVFASWKVGGRDQALARRRRAPSPRKCRRTRRSCARRCRSSRVEIFVTSGKPTRDTLKTSGTGLELDPVTHPNDLVAGSAGVVPAAARRQAGAGPESHRGSRRQPLSRQARRDDAHHRQATASSASPGRKPACTGWKRSLRDDKTEVQGVKERRAGYVATLEVLPQ